MAAGTRDETEMRLVIATLWDGSPALAEERAELWLGVRDSAWRVAVDAPFFDDPPPPVPTGSAPRLWEHEVVELFVFGAGERYLELELGPHGHHLLLELDGVRNPVRRHTALDYAPRRTSGRWSAVIDLPLSLVPPGAACVNAHAVHGTGSVRRYSSCAPCPGARPNFHAKNAALPLEPRLAQALERGRELSRSAGVDRVGRADAEDRRSGGR